MGEQMRAILAYAKKRGGSLVVEEWTAGTWQAMVMLKSDGGARYANRVATAPSPEEAIAKLAVMVGAARSN